MAESDELTERLRSGSRNLTIGDDVRSDQLEAISAAVEAAGPRPDDAAVSRPPSPSGPNRRRRILALTGTGVMALLLMGFMGLTTARSLPGDTLYPAKRAVERVLAAADSDLPAQLRLDELEALIERASPAPVIVEAQREAADALVEVDDPSSLDRYRRLAIGAPTGDGTIDPDYRVRIALDADGVDETRLSLPDGHLLDLGQRAEGGVVTPLGSWQAESADGQAWVVRSAGPRMPTVRIRFDRDGAEVTVIPSSIGPGDERALDEVDGFQPASGTGSASTSAPDDERRSSVFAGAGAEAGDDDRSSDGGGSGGPATTGSPGSGTTAPVSSTAPPTTAPTTTPTSTTTAVTRPTTTATRPPSTTTTTRPSSTTTTAAPSTTTTSSTTSTTSDDDDDDDDD